MRIFLPADTMIAKPVKQAQTDVRRAVARYRSALDAVRRYSGGIVDDAQRALDIKRHSYKKRGPRLCSMFAGPKATSRPLTRTAIRL